MRKLLHCLVAAILAAPGLVRAVDPAPAAEHATAYAALRLVGKTLGSDALSRVVEVVGRGGSPEPAQWKILLNEGSKGTREVDVSGGRITAQKSSSQLTSLGPIGLKDLNLDSSGALEATDAQARDAHVRFERVDYTLRVNANTGKPVWDLELQSATGEHLGGMRLAAHDGTVISMNGQVAGETARPDHDTVHPPTEPPSHTKTVTITPAASPATSRPPPLASAEVGPAPRETPRPDGGFFTRAGQTLDHTTTRVSDSLNDAGHTVDHHVRRAGATLQRFFTGHSDIDPGEPPPHD